MVSDIRIPELPDDIPYTGGCNAMRPIYIRIYYIILL